MAVKDKVPPASAEAEESVLGSVLIDNNALLKVSDFLRPEHFYQPAHGLIFESMLRLFEGRSPIDLVTVSEKLKELKALTKIGGKAYLAQLAARVPTSANVEYYGKIIRDLSAKRELITSSARITEKAFDESVAASELMDFAEQEVFALSQRNTRNAPEPIRSILTTNFDRLNELHKQGGGVRGVPTGFKSLDKLLSGMQPSNLLILAARPGVGKTAFSLNIARHVAVEQKIPVCIFSLEMSKDELTDRLLVRQGLFDAWKLKTAGFNDAEWGAYSEAMGILGEAPIYIDDSPGLTVTELRTKARRLTAEQDVGLIIVDYLQLMHGQTKDNRVQEVSEISQGLKNLARELKVPVLAAAQLSRAMEARGGKPRLSDLRESGSIEQDADVVIFLHRDNEEVREGVICSVAKHRNGPLGEINMYFNGKQVSFFDIEK